MSVLSISETALLPDGDFFFTVESGGFKMSQRASKSSTTHDGEIDGSDQGLTSPDKTGTGIDASGLAAHDGSMPSASKDEATAQAARKQEDADDLPSTP